MRFDRYRNDCDDLDPLTINTNELDADCDLIPTEIDCDDLDPLTINTNELDADCDLIETSIDCDDQDPEMMYLIPEDGDCDGIPTEQDCNDGDALLANDNDGNGNCDEYCEGSFVVSSAEDLQDIEICAYITGDITISYSIGFDINLLSTLTFIGGDLSIIGNISLLI